MHLHPKNYLFEANTLEAYIYEITFSIKLRMNKYQSLIYIHSSFAKKKTNIHSFHYLQSQKGNVPTDSMPSAGDEMSTFLS